LYHVAELECTHIVYSFIQDCYFAVFNCDTVPELNLITEIISIT